MASGAGKGESIPEPAPLMIMLKPPLATAGLFLCPTVTASDHKISIPSIALNAVQQGKIA